MVKRRQKKTRTKSGFAPFWLIFLKFLGFIILAGLLLLYWDSARLSSIISNARPVTQVTPDTNGIIRLVGRVDAVAAVTDEGKLRNRYALL
ncbi:hypothetical protein [Fontibacillus sp. BL9]|uniref:hypothetical protein n=1 Tax=Fontibacillus sp. BL9 TaxID=3389971 RepID=UPI00397C146B